MSNFWGSLQSFIRPRLFFYASLDCQDRQRQQNLRGIIGRQHHRAEPPLFIRAEQPDQQEGIGNQEQRAAQQHQHRPNACGDKRAADRAARHQRHNRAV